MFNKSKKVLLVFCFINLTFFVYYCLLPDINPSIDIYYYLSIADSYYQGKGFYDITSATPKPIITPQNGIVFIHILLRKIGLHDPDSRFLAIKIINYIGFLCLVFVFYKTFLKLKISSEVTNLCMGIILLSAHFLKTIVAPLNDGIFCGLTALIFYIIMSNETRNSLLKIVMITCLSIVIANFRLNGPLIIVSGLVTYVILRKISKALVYLIILIISLWSVYFILKLMQVDLSGIKAFAAGIYSIQFFINQAIITLILSIPGAFTGIDSREMIITLPISIVILGFYAFYYWIAVKEKNFPIILCISYIIVSLLFLQIMPGGSPRYIIMIVPFSLLIIANYFRDNYRLKISLRIVLLMTLSISLFRLFFWDSIYFANKKPLEYVRENIMEPYVLISQLPRSSYYIFNKRDSNIDDIDIYWKNIIIFGNKEYIDAKINHLKEKYTIGHIENIQKEFVLGHGKMERYNIMRICSN